MAKSRLTPALLPLAFATAPVGAQAPIPLTAEEAARVDGAMQGKPDPRACTGRLDEIVVCGHRFGGGGQRMEFEREPGEIVRHVNEPGRGTDALAADRCTRLCDVGVTVNLIAAAKVAPKIVRHILGRD